ncbi:acid phosphatase/Vanadium-dependent haloperoxidase, partial [Mycena pura]
MTHRLSFSRDPLSINSADSQALIAPMPPLRLSSPLPAAHRRQIFLSYAPDWLITVVLSAVFFSLDKVHGFRREFSLADARHVFVTDFVSHLLALYMIAVVAPVALAGLINFVTFRSLWDLHNSLLGLALGLSITGSLTQIVKLVVGRPRPDILDRCQPIPGSVNPVYGLSNSSVCTTSDDAYILLDGFRSFPSGHSSLSFAGLGFLAFYLAGKLHLFNHRGYVAKAWLSLTPFIGAALVAISRTMDNRHHWQDVLAGSALGTAVSYFSYRQYYPSLASEVCHRPYAPRITKSDLPSHHRQSSSLQYRDDNQPTHEDVFGSGPLEGTVLREGPGSLREAWNDGHHEEMTAQPSVQQNGIPLES